MSRHERLRMAPKVDQLGPSTSRCNIGKLDNDKDIPSVLYDPVQSRQYSLLNYLGKGAYGRCYEMEETAETSHGSRTKIALKVISKSTLKDYAHLEKIRKEVTIHKSLDHINIIKLLSFFEDSANVYMVLELGVHGTLLSNIQASMTGHLSELVARSYMREIVDAVVYIHEVAGILHRDLKPGNILLGLKNQVKLADFGLAVRITDLPKVSRALSGTPNYMSPEVLDGNGHSKESEAWALGCIFYCMVVGKAPFEAENLERTYSRIRGCSYFIPPEARVSERGRNLIHRLLDPDVGRRLKVIDIMRCDYFSNESSLKLLSSSQNSGSEIMDLDTLNIWHHKEASGALKRSSEQCDEKGYEPSMAGSYQTGVHSRDSGLDPDHMRSPKPDGPLLLLNLFMSGHINVTDEPCRPVNERIIMVNKWIDYTNKYGFGCVLSDGTECVQFVDGSTYSHRFATLHSGEQSQLVINPNERPLTVYEWSSVSDVSDAAIMRKIRLANLFSGYMHRELQSASPFAVIAPYMNYLIYQRRGNGAVIMVLSDGTTQSWACGALLSCLIDQGVAFKVCVEDRCAACRQRLHLLRTQQFAPLPMNLLHHTDPQINLLETHEKLVLRFEESGEVSLVVVYPEREMHSYRMSTRASVPTNLENRRVHDLIMEARCRLVDHSARPYYATQC